ncbi:MAG: rhodanese-like domain-containing protein [Verrucomicrobiaceae bacterium]|nr:rhodanese-like domain-containing protein [Verrucomicrobiaceae bacterium]
MLGCRPAPKTTPQLEPPAIVLPAAVKEITPDEAEAMLAAPGAPQIIDTRTTEEWKDHGHIAKAQNIDFLNEKAAQEQIGRLDKNRPVLVYCAIGGRARLMAVEMARTGFAELKVLSGGFNAWVAAGKAVEKDQTNR